MAKLKAYANTSVSLFKTQDDLERMLTKHGVLASRWTHFAETKLKPGVVRLEFEWERKGKPGLIGFRVEVGYKYEAGPKGGNRGTTREQAGRALFWHVKNLLDAVEFGIVDMEEAFFPYLLSASGKTVYEEAVPHLAKMPSANLLLNPGS